MLRIEELQPRLAPSGVRLFADTLLIRGSPNNDRVLVRASDEVIRVEIGKRWWQFERESVRALIFAGMGGRDQLLFDLAWEGEDGAHNPEAGTEPLL